MSASFASNGYAPFANIVINPGVNGAEVSSNYILSLGWTDILDHNNHPNNLYRIREEFIHLYQMRKYNLGNNGSSMLPVRGYLEFEAKLIADIQAYNQNKGYEAHQYALKPANNNIRNDYFTWLSTLTSNRTTWPSTIEDTDFQNWANLFAQNNSAYSYLHNTGGFSKYQSPTALTGIANQLNCN